MDDYISRQTAMNAFAKYVKRSNNSDFAPTPTWNDAVEIVENLPSVDAVEVVRCKDCVNCEYDSIFNQYWCGGSEVISDGFCNYGEREDPLHGAMNPPEDDITDGKGEAK